MLEKKPAFDFSKKVVLVTGSTKGIGAETARQFSRAGAKVYLHGRNREQGESLAEELGSVFIPADLSREEEIQNLIKIIEEKEKTLHVLVNNAGFEERAPLEQIPLETIDRIYRVNLRSILQLCRGLFPLLKHAEGSSVVNVSSVHETLPYPTNLPYSMFKSALKTFSETLAVEWAPYQIRVNNLSPGAILTDMNRSAIEAIGPRTFAQWIPSGRVGTVEEAASCCLFLASDYASYVTATSLLADGALSKGLLPYGRTQAMDDYVKHVGDPEAYPKPS